MTVERTVERPDGTVERTTTGEAQVVERRGMGAGGVIALILGLAVVVIVGYFLMNMSRNDAIETNAVAGAAESVGNAADNVGQAARDAVPAPSN